MSLLWVIFTHLGDEAVVLVEKRASPDIFGEAKEIEVWLVEMQPAV